MLGYHLKRDILDTAYDENVTRAVNRMNRLEEVKFIDQVFEETLSILLNQRSGEEDTSHFPLKFNTYVQVLMNARLTRLAELEMKWHTMPR